jgi:hypothetical protein
MSSKTAVTGAPTQTSSAARGVRLAIAALGLLTATATTVEAQTSPTKRWDLIVPSGMVVPTGAQRDAIKRANVTAVQISYAVAPAVAITGTVGWARSRDVASVDEPKLDVFTYDLGAEVSAPRMGSGISFSPFAGVGLGARSYNYRSLHVDATHNPAAYASVGGELGKGRVSLRLEARDYVTGFKPLDGRTGTDARNDVVVLVGLRIDWR